MDEKKEETLPPIIPKDIHVDFHSIINYKNHAILNTLAGNSYYLPMNFKQFYLPIFKIPALNIAFNGYNLHFSYNDKFMRVSVYGDIYYDQKKLSVKKRQQSPRKYKDCKSKKAYTDIEKKAISVKIAKKFKLMSK